MRIGVPKEIKDSEFRVGLTPSSVFELTHQGHDVLVETGAGQGSGLPDQAFQRQTAAPGQAPRRRGLECALHNLAVGARVQRQATGGVVHRQGASCGVQAQRNKEDKLRVIGSRYE